MTPPLVSIITAAFNAERFMDETIASVQAQTHRNWEWIIVDDGSRDETREVIRRAIARDPRIRLVCFPRNTGLAAAARNAAMRRAKGEYIAFLDADDLWLPTKLEEQLRVFDSSPGVAVVCTWYDVFGDEERARLWNQLLWRFGTSVVTIDQALQQSLVTSSVMMRRECFQKVGGMIASRRLTTGEDTEYWIRLVANFETRRICRALVRYRVNAEGDSLSTIKLDQKRNRDRELRRRLLRSDYLTESQKRKYAAISYYNSARDSLFHSRAPFRRDLYRSVLTMHAPPKALVMAALSFLPASLLAPLLKFLLKLKQR